MRKINFILLAAFLGMLTSCGVGVYYPYAHNVFGAQTTVHLDKANFRVVRDVEAVVAVTNTNLSRSSVEKSAYGQLLRNARLTGSQVLINVVIEEIRRDNGLNAFQYVAARATIIEFLDENGNPTVSQTYRPYQSTSAPTNSQSTNNINDKVVSTEAKTTDDITITTPLEDKIINEQNEILQKLNRYGWQRSTLYFGYKNALDYLIENEKWDEAKKVNKVLLDVLYNKIYGSDVEKQLRTNTNKGIPEYQTFLSFYK
jgi:hypothetical protein